MQIFGKSARCGVDARRRRAFAGEFHRGDRRRVRGAGQSARSRVRTLPFLLAQSDAASVRADCCIVGRRSGRNDGGDCCLRAPACATSCWRSTAIFCAIFAATRSIRRRSRSWTSWACSKSFLQRPHQEVTTLAGNLGDTLVTVADFTPSADALQVRRLHAAVGVPRLPGRGSEALSELRPADAGARARTCSGRTGRVAGRARATRRTGPLDVRADLTIAADGRESVLRRSAHLEVIELGAPMDVLWLRLTKQPDDPHETFGYIRDGRIMALIDRGDYWQCAYVIPKGTLAELQARGLEEFQRADRAIVPFLARPRRARSRAGTTSSCSPCASIACAQWYRPGLLCIGDAAHAMSPIGGVGINLAIQDAVAAANMLAPKTAARRRQRRRSAPPCSGGANAPRGSRKRCSYSFKAGIIGRVLANGRAPFLHRLPALVALAPVPAAHSRTAGRPRLPARTRLEPLGTAESQTSDSSCKSTTCTRLPNGSMKSHRNGGIKFDTVLFRQLLPHFGDLRFVANHQAEVARAVRLQLAALRTSRETDARRS